jgi:hypothetical protein
MRISVTALVTHNGRTIQFGEARRPGGVQHCDGMGSGAPDGPQVRTVVDLPAIGIGSTRTALVRRVMAAPTPRDIRAQSTLPR